MQWYKRTTQKEKDNYCRRFITEWYSWKKFVKESWRQEEKILKQVKKLYPNTKVAFSSIVTRKDKKDISKTVQDTNLRLKNYCSQKNIDFIQNSNIMEQHLGIKKLDLNKKGNSLLVNNFSNIWDLLFEMILIQTGLK